MEAMTPRDTVSFSLKPRWMDPRLAGFSLWSHLRQRVACFCRYQALGIGDRNARSKKDFGKRPRPMGRGSGVWGGDAICVAAHEAI